MSRQGNQRNDSSQMKAVLSHDQDSECNKDKDVRDRKEESKEKHNQAGCSSYTSSSYTSSSYTSSSYTSSSSAPYSSGAVIKFDHNSEKCNKEKDEHEREDVSTENSTPSSSSTTSFSFSFLSCFSSSSSSAPYSSKAMSKQDHHHDSSKKAKQDHYHGSSKGNDPVLANHNSEKCNRAGCSSSSTSSSSSSKMFNKEKNVHVSEKDSKENPIQAGCSSSSSSSCFSSTSSSSSSAPSGSEATVKQAHHPEDRPLLNPLIEFHPDSKNPNKEKHECEGEEVSKENSSQASSSTSSSVFPLSSSSSSSSSSAPSGSEAAKQGHDPVPVKDLIEFGLNSEKCNKENECEREHISKENSSQDDSSSFTSSSSSSSSTSTSSSTSSSSSAPSSSEAPSQMSKQDNESPDSKDLIDFGQKSEKVEKEKHEREREDVSEESSSRAGCSSFFSSSSASHSSEAANRRQAERDELTKHRWEEAASSCFQLDDLKPLPKCTNQLGDLKLSREHTILINVGFLNCQGNLVPQEGKDIWSSDVVKMPCSRSSIMEIKTGVLKKLTKVRRWEVITRQLEGLSKKTNVSVREMEEAIMKYNPKYSGQWSFDALSAFVRSVPTMENYFHSLVPKIAALALKLPEYVKKAIPLLRKKKPAKITLSQVQISSLLANAFFCTFPHRNTTHSKAEYHDFPTINFSSLFGNGSERKKQKLRAIMHYFKAVTDERTKPEGLVTFERRCLQDTNISDWRSCKDTMPKLHVTSQGTIETEGTGMLQVDFASSWIGGGVLGSGLVQEEILFLINPELIVSRLFTEKLEDNECLIITGSQQFSRHTGFGDSFEWAGHHEERLPRDEWKRLKRQILVIDALYFRHRMEQYSMSKVTRELNKAYCGFKGHEDDEPDIATGKWGCGAFNGDPQLKAVIQLMAAARAKRGLAFFTFEDEKLKRDLQQIYHLLVTEGTTVGKLFGLLENFCLIQQKTDGSHSLFEFIRNTIRPMSLL